MIKIFQTNLSTSVSKKSARNALCVALFPLEGLQSCLGPALPLALYARGFAGWRGWFPVLTSGITFQNKI